MTDKKTDQKRQVTQLNESQGNKQVVVNNQATQNAINKAIKTQPPKK
jgi:hypothetical protein